jgi:hypothetical protein
MNCRKKWRALYACSCKGSDTVDCQLHPTVRQRLVDRYETKRAHLSAPCSRDVRFRSIQCCIHQLATSTKILCTDLNSRGQQCKTHDRRDHCKRPLEGTPPHDELAPILHQRIEPAPALLQSRLHESLCVPGSSVARTGAHHRSLARATILRALPVALWWSRRR